jgi:hypothetical protein
MPNYLTKSKFKLALECPTKLYYIDKPEYANQKTEDSFLKALAEGGAQVEALARCYYPEGILIQADDNTSAVNLTNQYFEQETVVLFEAAIQYDHYFIRTDILIKNKNHLKLIEVKAKSINKEKLAKIELKKGGISAKWKPYIADVAFQKMVIQKAFPDCRVSTYLMLVDQDSLCPTDGLNQKFLLSREASGKVTVKISERLLPNDLSTPILKEINVVHFIEKIWNECDEQGVIFRTLVEQYSEAYFSGIKVQPVPKKACADCQFKTNPEDEKKGLKSGFKECWKEALQYNDADFQDRTVLDLWNYKKTNQNLKAGLIKLKDFHESDITIKDSDKPGLSTGQRQWLQISKVKNADQSVWLDEKNLRDEIHSWTYPLHFIDFETAMLSIPFKKGSHPYQGIAFQFSHHILDESGNVIHQGQYLNAVPEIDPTIDFIRALKAELEADDGTIFRYSDHENTYLNFIYRQLQASNELIPDKEDLCTFIKLITKSSKDSKEKWRGKRCMVDLLELVKQFYYDPLTNGSNSIKNVFPAILQRSTFLQNKYSKSIYGAVEGIPSKNFRDQKWIIKADGQIKDPYSLLAPINKEASNEELELLFDSDELKAGGAATIAYAKMQFTEMSDFERSELSNALLRYCELDTLAMVMIVEAWIGICCIP